jgi:hypothetical protein
LAGITYLASILRPNSLTGSVEQAIFQELVFYRRMQIQFIRKLQIMTALTPISPPSVLVVCLCAQWCGVCREYRGVFAQANTILQTQFPQARLLWIDVEDEADLLHPIDVEDFPTLLLAVGKAPRFLGTIEPRIATLEKLIRMVTLEASAVNLTDPEHVALVERILGWADSNPA